MLPAYGFERVRRCRWAPRIRAAPLPAVPGPGTERARGGSRRHMRPAGPTPAPRTAESARLHTGKGLATRVRPLARPRHDVGMSEQQSGAGYPQQPTSGQPQQQAYPQAPYASPQAQYQAQQQYAAYAPAGVRRCSTSSVSPPCPRSSASAVSARWPWPVSSPARATARTSSWTSPAHLFGIPSILTGVIVTFALTLFTGEKLRTLWKALTVAGASVFLAGLLYDVLSLPEGKAGSDASAWIGALFLVVAYGLFAAGAVMVPGSATAVAARPRPRPPRRATRPVSSPRSSRRPRRPLRAPSRPSGRRRPSSNRPQAAEEAARPVVAPPLRWCLSAVYTKDPEWSAGIRSLCSSASGPARGARTSGFGQGSSQAPARTGYGDCEYRSAGPAWWANCFLGGSQSSSRRSSSSPSYRSSA